MYTENNICGCKNNDECYENDTEQVMTELIIKAKEELIKEKIKKKLELIEGEKLDQLVDLLVEAKLDMHKNMMTMTKNKENIKEKIKAIWHKD
ncbi:MAG: hypothetical protein WC755_07265 [Candidatus Woesearchaeota archaeon]|jgi:hypothetical protein